MVSLPVSISLRISLSGGAAMAHIADGTATTRYRYYWRRSQTFNQEKYLYVYAPECLRVGCSDGTSCCAYRGFRPNPNVDVFIYLVACLFTERRPKQVMVALIRSL